MTEIRGICAIAPFRPQSGSLGYNEARSAPACAGGAESPARAISRRDGRVAERGGLLNRYRVKSSIGGSNPPLSASKTLLTSANQKNPQNFGIILQFPRGGKMLRSVN